VGGTLMIWATHRQKHAEQLAQAYKNLQKIKDRLSNAMAASNSHVWEYHRGDKTITAARFTDDLGYTRGKTISFDGFIRLIHRRDKEKFLHAWNAFLNTETTKLDVAYRLVSVEGKSFWYRDLGNYIKDDKDNSFFVTGTYNNITDSMQVQEKIRMFGDAFKNTHDWVLILARNGKFVGANSALYERFALTEHEDLTYQLMHKFQSDQAMQIKMFNVLDQLKPGEYHKEVTQLKIPDGPVVDIMLTIKAIENAYETHVIDNYMIIMTDITEQKNAERELMRIANYDDLTGLINRNLLMDRLVHGIEQCHRHSKQLGVIFIDLDRFKPINDSLGHEAGDTVLRAIGQRLKDNFRANDSVARLGGDEFVVLVDAIEHIEHLYPILDNLIKLIEMPVDVEKQTVSVSCSLGVSIYPQDGMSAHELIRNADIAMYYGKGQAHSGYQFYTDEMNETAREHLIMQNKIKVGHERKEFLNHYQAIFDIDLDGIVGFELLMRWKKGRQYISPELFIPVAEEIGMIVDMTRDAILRGIKDAVQWYAHGFDGYLSVNLSARHFETHFDVEEIVSWLQYYNLPTSAIRFEITENVLVIDQQKALSYMQAISDAGFIIALDDFGTGFSSLRYLKDFPFDVIKIDKSFVDGIGIDNNDEVIVLTTIAMAKSLNMKCIAEGIETVEQVDFFKKNDCRFLQGYYFSKPAPSLPTFALLRENLQNSKQKSTIEQ
jgi:diguanylate cyclase (GGDEF)-like protein/PAS domain S-box-containing protein